MQCSYDAEKHFIQMLMPEKDRNYMLFHDLLKLNNQTMTLTVNTTWIQEYPIQRVCCSFD